MLEKTAHQINIDRLNKLQELHVADGPFISKEEALVFLVGLVGSSAVAAFLLSLVG